MYVSWTALYQACRDSVFVFHAVFPGSKAGLCVTQDSKFCSRQRNLFFDCAKSEGLGARNQSKAGNVLEEQAYLSWGLSAVERRCDYVWVFGLREGHAEEGRMADLGNLAEKVILSSTSVLEC